VVSKVGTQAESMEEGEEDVFVAIQGIHVAGQILGSLIATIAEEESLRSSTTVVFLFYSDFSHPW